MDTFLLYLFARRLLVKSQRFLANSSPFPAMEFSSSRLTACSFLDAMVCAPMDWFRDRDTD
jgi:hypothetical protein